MSQGYSLHIGITKVNRNHYGSEFALPSCSKDSYDLQILAGKLKYKSFRFKKSEHITRKNVISSLEKLASLANQGDKVLITYSGHGALIPDRSSDESDKIDETWCLYDGQLLDDEIEYLLSLFKKGVRVVLISDSCHSKTVFRSTRTIKKGLAKKLPKNLDRSVSFDIYEKNRKPKGDWPGYDHIIEKINSIPKNPV